MYFIFFIHNFLIQYHFIVFEYSLLFFRFAFLFFNLHMPGSWLCGTSIPSCEVLFGFFPIKKYYFVNA